MKRFFYIILICFQFSYSQEDLKYIVYFETDKYSIPETENYRLLLFLNAIKKIDIDQISIYGFCDDRGSESYNLNLSQNRADAIKEVFSNNEFDESLITNIDGKGELLLNIIKETDIQKIRGLNRKVEVIVTPVYPSRKIKLNFKDLENTLRGDLKIGDKVILENLLFDRGYSYLVQESKEILNKVADILVKRKDIYFTIEGHVCCTNGTRDAIDGKTKKRNLSHARAKYVYDYLANKGVSKRRMKYIGMRRKFPLGGPQRFDRRVELLVTKTDN
jgi:outer membrane protein OmpA-like peptidoglycan-associated protein